MLLFTQYETTWLTAISSHCLAALPTNVSTFNSVAKHLLPVLPTGLHQKRQTLSHQKANRQIGV